jgi:hypothetical protein
VEIRSLEELRQPDERALVFSPLGLGGRLRPEDAAVFRQEVISHAELVPAVAEGTRSTFERLRRLDLPRNPDVAAGLAEDERRDIWYLVRADFPLDSFGHTLHVAAGTSSCSTEDPRWRCPAEILGVGSWEEMISLARAAGITVMPRTVPDVSVTSLMGWPRYKELPVAGT